MEATRLAAILRITGHAVLDVAAVVEGTAAVGQAAGPTDTGKVLAIPAWAAKRMAYLQAYVDAGGTLTLQQVTAAGKAAGLHNPGSVTAHGYISVTGQYTRAITEKGLTWLEGWTGKAA